MIDIYMNSSNTMKYVFIALWLAILAYLISLMAEICKPQLDNTKQTTAAATRTTSASADTFKNSDNTFDYTENFEPSDATPDIGDNAAPRGDVANQNVNFTPAVDNSKVLENNVTQDDNEELLVEGTDALIAASSDRFYSIDTKGQTNRNASNDLRGDLPIAYNSNYTPFNQSAIYGEPLVPGGRL
jgi:hypothetical protein